MTIRFLIGVLLAFSVLISSADRGSAGGMATVHLDAVPTDVRVGVPVSIGFMVLHHDITPVNVDSAVLAATHRTSGDTIQVPAIQTGATGHYVADVTFPIAGSWKWSITPAPFAGTSFESIEVMDTVSADSTWTAELTTGTCFAPDSLVVTFDPFLAPTAPETGTSSPVEVVHATLDVAPRDLTLTPHSLNIQAGDDTIACADMTGTIRDGVLIVGIHAVGESGANGIVMVDEVGTGIELTLYISRSVVSTVSNESVVPAMTVEIVDRSGSWGFSPANLSVPVGTQVTWINTTDTSHTVTGQSLQFEDSGPILPGDSWSQTFSEAGTFEYICSPHPFMTGSVMIE